MGYITWIFLNPFEMNYVLAYIIGLIIVTSVGAAIYQFLLTRIRGMHGSEIIVSFAVGLAIMEGLRWGGFIGQTYILPTFIEGTVNVAGVPIDFQRLIIIGVAMAVMGFLWFFTHYTKVGLALRAIAQDERAAMMLGIDSNLTAVIALSLGSALAGIAAIVIIPLGNMTVETGYNVLIDALAVCIIGGIGSWPGAIIGSFVLGFGQILTLAFIAPQWQTVVVFLTIILVLIVRPSGFFGRQKELEERV
jgi:branched-chain amino acid transport system permease protein